MSDYPIEAVVGGVHLVYATGVRKPGYHSCALNGAQASELIVRIAQSSADLCVPGVCGEQARREMAKLLAVVPETIRLTTNEGKDLIADNVRSTLLA